MLTSYEQHDLANAHPVYLKGQQRAEKAQADAKKQALAKAERLRERAAKLYEEAYLLEQAAGRYNYGHDIYLRIEDEAYWQARRVVAAANGIPLQEVLDHEAYYYAELRRSENGNG